MKLFISTAASKKQLTNAELVFGRSGEKVVAGLETIAKAFKHAAVVNFLNLLKEDPEYVGKWANSKSGTVAVEFLKVAGTAKSLDKVIEALANVKAIPRKGEGVKSPRLDDLKPGGKTVAVKVNTTLQSALDGILSEAVGTTVDWPEFVRSIIDPSAKNIAMNFAGRGATPSIRIEVRKEGKDYATIPSELYTDASARKKFIVSTKASTFKKRTLSVVEFTKSLQGALTSAGASQRLISKTLPAAIKDVAGQYAKNQVIGLPKLKTFKAFRPTMGVRVQVSYPFKLKLKPGGLDTSDKKTKGVVDQLDEHNLTIAGVGSDSDGTVFVVTGRKANVTKYVKASGVVVVE